MRDIRSIHTRIVLDNIALHFWKWERWWLRADDKRLPHVTSRILFYETRMGVTGVRA